MMRAAWVTFTLVAVPRPAWHGVSALAPQHNARPRVLLVDCHDSYTFNVAAWLHDAGADADIVLYDPNRTWTISEENHHMNMDHSAWEGFEINGHVHTVMSRGRVIIENDTYTGSTGHGHYVRRSLSDYLI